MKKERNRIAHEIRNRQKYEHNARIKDIVEEIGNASRAGNSKEMYAAVKNLNRKSTKELTVKDKDGKTIVAPTEVYKTAFFRRRERIFRCGSTRRKDRADTLHAPRCTDVL